MVLPAGKQTYDSGPGEWHLELCQLYEIKIL